MFKFQKSIYIAFLMLVVAFVSLSYVHEVIKMAVFSDFGDFGTCYFYSKLSGRNYNIYTLDEAAEEELKKEFKMPMFNPFTVYLPVFLFLFRGFTFFEYHLASIIWLLLNNIFLFSSILIILRLAYERIVDIDRKFICFSSIFLVLSFQPLIENMFLGQLTLLILFFFVLCLYFLSKKKYVLSGCFLSLGVLIKPHLGILLPFFLWKRQYRVFFSALILFIILEISSIFINNNLAIEFYYWTAVVKKIFMQSVMEVSMRNLSLVALINRIANLATHPDYFNIVHGLTFLFTLVLFIYTLYITRGKFRDFDLKFILEFSLFIIFLFIAFPVVHEHHYVLLYLPIIFLWAKLSRDIKLIPLFLFIVSFSLIGLKYSLVRIPIFSFGFLSIFSGFKLYGVLILFFLTAHMIKEESVGDIQ